MAAGVCTSPGKGGRWGRVGKVIRNDFEEFSKLDGLEPRLAVAVANQLTGQRGYGWGRSEGWSKIPAVTRDRSQGQLLALE